MNRITLLTILLLIGITAPCQSKKERKKNKIKSTTEWETTTTDGKSSTYKTTYEEFDKAGHSILKIDYAPDGTILEKSSAVYDNNGNKISETEFNAEKKRDIKRTFRYNALKDKVEENEYHSSGELLAKTVYTYDANGNKLTETETDAAGNVVKKNTYTYNSKNLKTGKSSAAGLKKKEKSKKWDYVYY